MKKYILLLLVFVFLSASSCNGEAAALLSEGQMEEVADNLTRDIDEIKKIQEDLAEEQNKMKRQMYLDMAAQYDAMAEQEVALAQAADSRSDMIYSDEDSLMDDIRKIQCSSDANDHRWKAQEYRNKATSYRNLAYKYR